MLFTVFKNFKECFGVFLLLQSQMFSCLLMIMMMPRMGERMPTNERENECSMCEFVCLAMCYLVNRHKKLIFISFVVRISTSTPSLKTHFVCLLLDECCWEGGWVGLAAIKSSFWVWNVRCVQCCTLYTRSVQFSLVCSLRCKSNIL